MSIRIAEEIINGRRLNREDDLAFFMEEDLDSLCRGADEIRRRLRGDRADLCSIINGRSGRCGEDCKFCAQSSCHNAKINEYPFLEPEEILEDCRRHERQGVGRYSVVTAGRALNGREMDLALRAYRSMKENCKIELLSLIHIFDIDEWGKKRLAYEIQKIKEGFYYFIHFESDSVCPNEVEAHVRIIEPVIRYLCVKQEA